LNGLRLYGVTPDFSTYVCLCEARRTAARHPYGSAPAETAQAALTAAQLLARPSAAAAPRPGQRRQPLTSPIGRDPGTEALGGGVGSVADARAAQAAVTGAPPRYLLSGGGVVTTQMVHWLEPPPRELLVMSDHDVHAVACDLEQPGPGMDVDMAGATATVAEAATAPPPSPPQPLGRRTRPTLFIRIFRKRSPTTRLPAQSPTPLVAEGAGQQQQQQQPRSRESNTGSRPAAAGPALKPVHAEVATAAIIVVVGGVRVGAIVLHGGDAVRQLAPIAAAANLDHLVHLPQLVAAAAAAECKSTSAAAAASRGLRGSSRGHDAGAVDAGSVAAVRQLSLTLGRVCWDTQAELISAACEGVRRLSETTLLAHLAICTATTLEAAVLAACRLPVTCTTALLHSSGLAAAILEDLCRGPVTTAGTSAGASREESLAVGQRRGRRYGTVRHGQAQRTA
jgi:hypothetical protein